MVTLRVGHPAHELVFWSEPHKCFKLPHYTGSLCNGNIAVNRDTQSILDQKGAAAGDSHVFFLQF
jgi:hypothetical protein